MEASVDPEIGAARTPQEDGLVSTPLLSEVAPATPAAPESPVTVSTSIAAHSKQTDEENVGSDYVRQDAPSNYQHFKLMLCSGDPILVFMKVLFLPLGLVLYILYRLGYHFCSLVAECLVASCKGCDKIWSCVGYAFKSTAGAIGSCCHSVYGFCCKPCFERLAACFAASCKCLFNYTLSPIGKCVSFTCESFGACMTKFCSCVAPFLCHPLGKCMIVSCESVAAFFEWIGRSCGCVYEYSCGPVFRLVGHVCMLTGQAVHAIITTLHDIFIAPIGRLLSSTTPAKADIALA